MRMSEIKQPTLQQSNIDALKKRKEITSTQLKQAQQKQKQANAVKKIQQANQTLSKIRTSM
jgi:hypothetical protein